jgi:hypothetical protein
MGRLIPRRRYYEVLTKYTSDNTNTAAIIITPYIDARITGVELSFIAIIFYWRNNYYVAEFARGRISLATKTRSTKNRFPGLATWCQP